MFEGRENALLRDLVEHQATDLFSVPAAELFGEVPADCLALPIRVGRDVDLCRLLRFVLEFLQDLLPARKHFVRRLEPFVHVDPQLALGQIADVAHRGDDLVVSSEIFVDGLRLRRRFDHHK